MLYCKENGGWHIFCTLYIQIHKNHPNLNWGENHLLMVYLMTPSISNCMLPNRRMTVNNDLKACGRKRSCPNVRYHSGTEENHTECEDSWCTGQDLAQAPSRCKSDVCTVSASLFSEHHSQCHDYTAFMTGWFMTAEQSLEWELAAVPLCPQQIPNPGCCVQKPPVTRNGQSSVWVHLAIRSSYWDEQKENYLWTTQNEMHRNKRDQLSVSKALQTRFLKHHVIYLLIKDM